MFSNRDRRLSKEERAELVTSGGVQELLDGLECEMMDTIHAGARLEDIGAAVQNFKGDASELVDICVDKTTRFLVRLQAQELAKAETLLQRQQLDASCFTEGPPREVTEQVLPRIQALQDAMLKTLEYQARIGHLRALAGKHLPGRRIKKRSKNIQEATAKVLDGA